MKKVISLLLVLISLSFICLEVNAQTTVTNGDELERESYYFRRVYVSGYDVPNMGPYYAEESVNLMLGIINDNLDLVERSENGEEITPEMFQAGYDRMVEAVEFMYMDDKELELLIKMNKSQKNLDNYFDDDMWNEYQQAIISAEEALASGDLKSIDEHYYKMLYQHVKLCAYNPTGGDVNGDGIFNVNDVTYYQKKLANNPDDLNYSQILVSLVIGSDIEPNINTATNIQKELVGLLAGRSFLALSNHNSLLESENYINSYFYKDELRERHRIENPGLYDH